MADVEQLEKTKSKSKLPIIIGLVLMLGLGGGGFFAVYSGMILAPEVETDDEDLMMLEEEMVSPLPDVAFVPVDPLIINLAGKEFGTRHLRFQAQLEVPSRYEAEIITLMPRIMDILNGYLRALDVSDLESSAALIRLRAHMLRRLQIVAGEGRIKDVLIMEFVIN